MMRLSRVSQADSGIIHHVVIGGIFNHNKQKELGVSMDTLRTRGDFMIVYYLIFLTEPSRPKSSSSYFVLCLICTPLATSLENEMDTLTERCRQHRTTRKYLNLRLRRLEIEKTRAENEAKENARDLKEAESSHVGLNLKKKQEGGGGGGL